MKKPNNIIHLKDCKHGYLYKIKSRNLTLGVFDSSTKGFIGIRTKFSNQYLFTEIHWDACSTYGTVCPVKELCACPHKIDEDIHVSKPLYKWLETMHLNYELPLPLVYPVEEFKL